MIIVYSMHSCPDCQKLEEELTKYSSKFKVIDIGEHVLHLKEFLKIRDSKDNAEIFKDVKEAGGVGIPCFVLENGTITFNPEEVGLEASQL